MPIVKKNEPLPERPVVIMIYGDPGIGKTSLGNTANEPLLIDFDRGKDRAIHRQDVLVVNSWADVDNAEKEKLFANYKTINIDTAKAALDDFLMVHVVQEDYKLAKNKLGAYGAIGDKFKLFINARRQENADIIVINHAKTEKEGDYTRTIPDVTGQSYQLLLRVCDQVGYLTMMNGKRVIKWDPTDGTIGKNVARLPVTEVPGEGDPGFKTFMAEIVEKTRKSIAAMSEAQLAAQKQSDEIQAKIVETSTPEALTLIVSEVRGLPLFLSTPLRSIIKAKADELKYAWTGGKEDGKFEVMANGTAAQTVASVQDPSQPTTSAAAGETPTTGGDASQPSGTLFSDDDGVPGEAPPPPVDDKKPKNGRKEKAHA